ncbi:DUF3331 domain-containing protein [Paraburkholderia bengalensis]|uniref:DUF3331 domain-containing protein n=2 Tax=Paraburkholderia bengalensis TaxID=2747562 RepID=A0ABU8J141_9BURK
MELKCDAWAQTLSLLGRISSTQTNGTTLKVSAKEADRNLRRRKRRRRSDCGRPLSAFVSVLERCSPTLVLLSWCDATAGRYGDQRWRLRVAHGKAVCALSGAMIERGDLVYRPCTRGQECPMNADHSILAEALDRLEQESNIAATWSSDRIAN